MKPVSLRNSIIALALALTCCKGTSSSPWFRGRITPRHRIEEWSNPSFGAEKSNLLLLPRGGDVEDDEERYSRQVYTLGARAHGLIRSSTIYLDGPPQSGLLFECAKNLALSGVRHLVLVTTPTGDANDDDDGDDTIDQNYHNAALDDLGRTYQRGAKSEIFGGEASAAEPDQECRISDSELLVEYLQRLNPNIVVSSIQRSSLIQKEHDTSSSSRKAVFLCIDRPYLTQVKLNGLSRTFGWPFIAVETAGVFGRTFCDFGASFQVVDADGETPVVTPLHRIELQDDNKMIVRSVEGEKHDVSKGDRIQFQYRNGELSQEPCVVTDVQTPYRFVVEMHGENSTNTIENFVSKINEQAASFRRVKIPLELTFQPLQSAIEAAKTGDDSLFTPCDLEKSFDSTRRRATLACFQALASFAQTKKRLPTETDENEFWKLAQKCWPLKDNENSDKYDKEDSKRYCMIFLRGCAAKFAPLQAVFGAIGAQEALKAVTSLYSPVRQFLLYDCDEVLCVASPARKMQDNEVIRAKKKNDMLYQAPGLRYVLGDKVVDKLQKRRIFVVGAGAIGCEILKNLASMGVGTRKKGALVLTDMDSIEKSNLSRQLLFRDSDIGKFKSVAAQDAALRLNPSMKIEAHSSKVGATGHSPFDDRFWSNKVDIVLNALDNVEARLYMDAQCVANKKALVDAGTMGSKGNVQVVVPNQSESYASSADPPEPAIPVCTLKNFPYLISHTIQWGRDLFDGLFQRRPEQANDFMDAMAMASVADLAVRFTQEKGKESAIEAAEELVEDLVADTTSTDIDIQQIRATALTWAADLSWKLFYKSSADLLQQHPLDSVDEDGEPFWSGTRRPPKLLSYVASPQDADKAVVNANLVEFVRNAARLRVESLLGDDCAPDTSDFNLDDVERACIAINPHSEYNLSGLQAGGTADDSSVSRVRLLLEKVVVGPRRLTSVEFEKDDDANGHVAFVAAASNLRAIAYGIPPVDAMETRRVAGNIVPAMITTTAFVSALSCIELVKLVQQADLRFYRNAFINLALPFFAFTVPLPAEEIAGLHGRRYTLWDQLSIKEGKKAAASGGITIRSLLKRIKKQASDDPSQVDVASISCGPYMLYANFLHEDDEEVLNAPIWELVNNVILSGDTFENDYSRDGDECKSELIVNEAYLDLTVVVEDAETGDEVELPPLRVERFKE